MNTRVQKLWVDALRSGEYKQGKGVLTSADGEYDCCLGVLCKLAEKENVLTHSIVGHDVKYGEDGEMAILPHEVMYWADLPNGNPNVSYELNPGDEDNYMPNPSLAELNDAGKDFNTIADIIEEQL